jgi:hypothetical protein
VLNTHLCSWPLGRPWKWQFQTGDTVTTGRTETKLKGNSTRGLLGVEHLTDPDIWFVSYRTNITLKRDDGGRRPVRGTRKFKLEAEAKKFAQEMIKEGWSAIAGTLNPHTPKKTVASTQILDWIAGKH